MSDILVSLLREVSSHFQDRFQEMCAVQELNLAPFQARVLSVIGRRPAISQLALAASTGRDKAQVARAVKALESRGFVMRSAHESSWRTQCLELTETGQRASTAIERERADLIAKALTGCDAKEHDALLRSLEKINQAISSPERRASGARPTTARHG